jgi:hypothetical protein
LARRIPHREAGLLQTERRDDELVDHGRQHRPAGARDDLAEEVVASE